MPIYFINKKGGIFEAFLKLNPFTFGNLKSFKKEFVLFLKIQLQWTALTMQKNIKFNGAKKLNLVINKLPVSLKLLKSFKAL